ncbi:hypothetical protein H6G76_12205 [Nostoc sp. FACHB-152]|uniref:hypothetical protein n=1 Tax=unclassified Nostoc TaxID=2593658 RepID=UPI0016870BC4|nr:MULTISPECIES: hypothetical protein [unclassified Nostoc]MBD2447927.1 hypothetical protein [Nostoc sp. FACHB-152]MBD2468499.1 hypothetical protein [Nostoc sp. FACHB-145]
MPEVANYHQKLTSRIIPIVQKLFKRNSLYLVKLNQQEMIEMLVDLFGKFTPEEMQEIQDDDLTDRINSILVLEAVSGTLNDLTPEQIAIFDASVEGK